MYSVIKNKLKAIIKRAVTCTLPGFIIVFILVLMTILPSLSQENLINNSQEVIIHYDNLAFTKISSENSKILKRYLLGNYRWDCRKDRGLCYAIKRNPDNKYNFTDLNGYVFLKPQDEKKEIYTNVLIAFDTYCGYPNTEMITFTSATEKNLKVSCFREDFRNSMLISYIILESNGIFIEVYERSSDPERNTTKKILEELNSEFLAVLAGSSEIEKNGTLTDSTFYPGKFTNSFFEIGHGEKSGIYKLNASLVNTEPCEIYARVFYLKTGVELSANAVHSMSLREIGWSVNADRYFHYNSEIKIFEGEFSKPYPVRFELWSSNSLGITRKLAEKTALVKGWNRKGSF